MALLATAGGARPAITLRAAASSVAPGTGFALVTPCVLASLGARDPGIHHCHQEDH
jgi:hypothetical protein